MTEQLTRYGKRIVEDSFQFTPQLIDFSLNFQGSNGTVRFRYEDKAAVLEIIDQLRDYLATDPVPEVPVQDPPGA
ncbi:hypothetical protein [Amycolatopsis sp. NPDC003731]